MFSSIAIIYLKVQACGEEITFSRAGISFVELRQPQRKGVPTVVQTLTSYEMVVT
jgi:hypothetical protein